MRDTDGYLGSISTVLSSTETHFLVTRHRQLTNILFRATQSCERLVGNRLLFMKRYVQDAINSLIFAKWRKMQYDMNCVMKRYCEVIGVNLSVLPPCTNYDLWRKPAWRKSYSKPLDEVTGIKYLIAC